MIGGGPSGQVSIKMFRPQDASGVLPVLLFTHGAGWVFGDAHTHGRLVAELATRAGAAAVFTNYSLSPEAKYPTALEEIYAALEWIAAHGAGQGLDPARIAVAGDSVGGNMTTAITIMAKQRGGPHIAAQLLYYPVTNANFDTGSYQQFATHYWLTRQGMQWYWDQYTTDPAARAQITASPLRASLEDLAGLPPAMIIVGEADPLRDEARPTPPSSARPACRSPPSDTRALFTTSSWSTLCATPTPPWPPPPKAGSSCTPPCTTSKHGCPRPVFPRQAAIPTEMEHDHARYSAHRRPGARRFRRRVQLRRRRSRTARRRPARRGPGGTEPEPAR
jgi:dienelactone hydrolase